MKALPVHGRNQWQTIVLHADSGAGKSTLAASAPRPFFLDSNKGLLSIADVAGLEHVRRADVHGMGDLDEAYDNLTGTGKKDWSEQFDTIVFDHFDDIQGIVMDDLGDARAKKDSRFDEDEMQQKDYGTMGNKLRRYLRKFKRVPKHKILICGSSPDFESGQWRPSLVGALKHQLPYFCDHCMYLRVGKKHVRYLHLDETDKFYAKTRARWLPPDMRKFKIPLDDPTFLTRLFTLLAAGAKGFPEARLNFLSPEK